MVMISTSVTESLNATSPGGQRDELNSRDEIVITP
jgi:hypothetical protein